MLRKRVQHALKHSRNSENYDTNVLSGNIQEPRQACVLTVITFTSESVRLLPCNLQHTEIASLCEILQCQENRRERQSQLQWLMREVEAARRLPASTLRLCRVPGRKQWPPSQTTGYMLHYLEVRVQLQRGKRENRQLSPRTIGCLAARARRPKRRLNHESSCEQRWPDGKLHWC